jgi:hypothetical protein
VHVKTFWTESWSKLGYDQSSENVDVERNLELKCPLLAASGARLGSRPL